MDDATLAAAQTPESTGLPIDLFQKAQAAATEKGRPIYVYRAERAGRYTSKWERVEGATAIAIIEPLPTAVGAAAAGPPHALRAPSESSPSLPVVVADEPPDASPRIRSSGEQVMLYAAGGQTVGWDGATQVAIEESGRVVRFCRSDGGVVRLVIGGGSISIATPETHQ